MPSTHVHAHGTAEWIASTDVCAGTFGVGWGWGDLPVIRS